MPFCALAFKVKIFYRKKAKSAKFSQVHFTGLKFCKVEIRLRLWFIGGQLVISWCLRPQRLAIFAAVMRIAINIDGVSPNDNIWNKMVEMLFQHIAAQQLQHLFVFISGKSAPENWVKPVNVSRIVIGNPPSTGLSFKLWYDYKLSSFLKKQKVDVFVNVDAVCSLRSNIPQILLVKDLAFLSSGPKTNANGFIKKRLQKSLAKAEKIIVFNQQSQTQLIENYTIADKIALSNLFADPNLQPMDWQEKEAIKEKYSEGKEFFLYSMTKENPIDLFVLLKAFSLFKKRQQSNMQLLLAGETKWFPNNFIEKLATYKYRNEIKILDGLREDAIFNLTASAYCLSPFFGFWYRFADVKSHANGRSCYRFTKRHFGRNTKQHCITCRGRQSRIDCGANENNI